MDKLTKEAMDRGGIADITTVGRKSGKDRRIEIYFHQLDGDYYLTGMPRGPRDWMANITAHPEFTLHLKKGIEVDVVVVGYPEPDANAREEVIRKVRVENWGADPDQVETELQQWVDVSPFVRFSPV